MTDPNIADELTLFNEQRIANRRSADEEYERSCLASAHINVRESYEKLIAARETDPDYLLIENLLNASPVSKLWLPTRNILGAAVLLADRVPECLWIHVWPPAAQFSWRVSYTPPGERKTQYDELPSGEEAVALAVQLAMSVAS